MRYLPLTQQDRTAMCKTIGVAAPEALFAPIPAAARLQEPLPLPPHQPEYMVEAAFKKLAAKNLTPENAAFFLGGGVYRHHIPAAVDYLIQRGEFLTSYTPYQPEIAQGTLQYLFEFQTQVAMLTGMDVANASLYDGSTAMVEAILMANRITKKSKALVADTTHPHYVEVAQTYALMTGFDVAVSSVDALFQQLKSGSSASGVALPKDDASLQQRHPSTAEGSAEDPSLNDISCIILQYPTFFGEIEDYRALAAAAHAKGILVIAVVTEIISLGALEPPAAWGADIVVAEGQSLGVPMSFGGPHVGLFACKQEFVRQMPGRLCGETVDTEGRRSFVLTLSTREQHIRRDKATSNICTNSGLCALAFSIHLALLGGESLEKLAALNHAKAAQLAQKLEENGVTILNKTFFNEFTVRLNTPAAPLVEKLSKQNILAGIPLSRFYPDRPNDLLVAVSELTTEAEMTLLATVLHA